MVKTANRLIGEVENQDLYNSDDEPQNQHDPLNFAGNLELDLNQTSSMINASELDLGVSRIQPKKEMNFLIKKIQDKKHLAANSVENQVVSLGLVQNLSKQLSANELAAKGIKLSIRDSIIDFIRKEMDHNQQAKPDVQQLLVALESEKLKEVNDEDVVVEPKRESVQDYMTKEDALPSNQITQLLKQATSAKNQDGPENDEEESGLLFVDPEVEKRAQIEKDKQQKKKEVPMIKLKDGRMVPSNMIAGMTMGLGGPSSSSAGNSAMAAGNANRRNLIQNLKQAQIQKRSQNITFDKIKETFQCTELDEDKSKKQSAAALFSRKPTTVEGGAVQDSQA